MLRPDGVLSYLLFVILSVGLTVRVVGQEVGPANSASGASEETRKTDEEGYRARALRRLQSNGLLVETAYHQEAGEVQHMIKFMRSKTEGWTSTLAQEWPVINEKHQMSFSLPNNFIVKDREGNRGVGDLTLQYSYFLLGDNTSRVTVSPTVGLALPTGSVAKGFGAGGSGLSAGLPISVMLSNRFAYNSNLEVGHVSSAKNADGERFRLLKYEVGQSLVWFARPKFNVLVEAVWERARATGDDFKETDHELFISPGVRWAHVFRNGLTVIPGFSTPIGVGPSRGDRGVLFYLAIEHPFGGRRE